VLITEEAFEGTGQSAKNTRERNLAAARTTTPLYNAHKPHIMKSTPGLAARVRRGAGRLASSTREEPRRSFLPTDILSGLQNHALVAFTPLLLPSPCSPHLDLLLHPLKLLISRQHPSFSLPWRWPLGVAHGVACGSTRGVAHVRPHDITLGYGPVSVALDVPLSVDRQGVCRLPCSRSVPPRTVTPTPPPPPSRPRCCCPISPRPVLRHPPPTCRSTNRLQLPPRSGRHTGARSVGGDHCRLLHRHRLLRQRDAGGCAHKDRGGGAPPGGGRARQAGLCVRLGAPQEPPPTPSPPPPRRLPARRGCHAEVSGSGRPAGYHCGAIA